MEAIDFEGIIENCESDDNSLPSKELVYEGESGSDHGDEDRFESIDFFSRSISMISQNVEESGENLRCLSINSYLIFVDR